jgi:signal transduction histidine kinase
MEEHRTELSEGGATTRPDLEELPAPAWLTDASGALVYANRAALEFMGDAGSGLFGLEYAKLMHPDDLRAWRCARRLRKAFTAEARVKTVAGVGVGAGAYARVMMAARPTLTGWSGVSMSLEGVTNAALIAQKGFVADASHELRAPLTGIQGNLELLRRYPEMPQSERLEIVEDAVRSATRLGRLVTDMLALSRGDGVTGFNAAPMNLETVLREVFAEARRQPNQADLDIGVLEPSVVSGERDRLKQLVLILVHNALRYTPATGQVRLTLRRSAESAELRVSDNGEGISAAELPRVFERFYRAEHAQQLDPGGTGLGLAIAKLIVEQHGGSIRLESQLGLGTTAIVTLPISE